MKFTKENLCQLKFTNEEAIDLIWILCQKLKEEPIDLTESPPAVVGFIQLTFGTSYNDLHPTDISKKGESYCEWIQKRISGGIEKNDPKTTSPS